MHLKRQLKHGYKKKLKFDDLKQLFNDSKRAECLHRTIEHEWNKLLNSDKRVSKPSILTCLIRVYGVKFLFAAFFKLFHDICNLIFPLLLWFEI